MADSKMFEIDKYFRECQQSNQPFVKARKNPVDDNYLVQMDLLSCNYILTIKEQEQIRRFFQKETDYLERAGLNKSIYKGSNVDAQHTWYDGILPERLDTFCISLFELALR